MRGIFTLCATPCASSINCPAQVTYDLSGILRQPPVSGLQVAKLSLEDSERMLDLRTNAGLQSFDFVVDCIDTVLQVQLSSLAGSHRNKRWPR